MKEFIKDVLIALVIVVVITLIIKPTIVKESSMESTLYENNYLFVNKLGISDRGSSGLWGYHRIQISYPAR